MNATINKPLFVLFLILFFLMAGENAIAKNDFAYKKIPPRNTVAKNASADQFVKKLLWIVKTKNLKALMGYIDSEIYSSFGGDPGIDDFQEYWGLNKTPKKSKLWDELDTVLRLGGIMKGREMVFPYLFVDWPDGFDAFDYQAIIGNRVNLRKKPSMGSKIIRQLNYEIVLPFDNPPPHDNLKWYKIRTYDNKIGYVNEKYIRSPIDYRLFIKKTKKGWRINTMIAGD